MLGSQNQMSLIDYDPGSFKDPDGRVFYSGQKIFRSLSATGAERMRWLDAEGHLAAFADDGLIIPSRLVDASSVGLGGAGVGETLIEHARVGTMTYPFEWPFELLRDAALITLDINERCLAFDFILKDATPYNIALYRGRPVLIDLLSIDRYEAGMPWKGYAQYCREFLFPLLLASHKKVVFQDMFRGGLNGVGLETTDGIFTRLDIFKPGVLKHVKLQAMLQRSFRKGDFDAERSFSEGGFNKDRLIANLHGLRKILGKLSTRASGSTWIDYTSTHSYSDDEEGIKARFVKSMLDAVEPARVVDLGCNTGTYSRLAAERADEVVAVDSDAACIDSLYRQLRGEGAVNIVPVVVDLLNPSPAMGWMLSERKSLFDRFQGDAFLALALVHHLAISGNVPLDDIVAMLARVAPTGVVEWVDKSDPMVELLLRNRKDVFDRYGWAEFQRALETKFEIAETIEIGGGRRRLCRVRALAR